MGSIFYITRWTRNGTMISGYFLTFEEAHDALIKNSGSHYGETDTTGNIYMQEFGLNKEPHLVCARHGEDDIIEDYYNEHNKRVRSVKYKHKYRTASYVQTQVRDYVKNPQYIFGIK